MASKLGDFFVELGAVPNTKGIDKFGSSLKSLRNLAISVGIAILGFGGAFVGLVKNTADETAELGRMSKILGVSVGQLDELQKVFVLAGGHAQDATALMAELNDTITGFKGGEGSFEGLGKWLNIAPQEFTGNFLKDIELIRTKLQTISPNPQEWESRLSRAGIGANAIKVLSLSSKEYENLRKQAESTGLATKKQVDNATDFYKQMMLTNQAFTQFKRNLMSTTSPEFSKAMEDIRKLFTDKDFQKGVSDFFTAIIESLPPMIKGLELVMELLTAILAPSPEKKQVKLTPEKKQVKLTAEERKFEKYKHTGNFKYLLASSEEEREGLSMSQYAEKYAKERKFEEYKHTGNFKYLFASPKERKGLSMSQYAEKYANAQIGTYAPVININAGSTDPKMIADAVDKKLKTHFKETQEKLKTGKIS
jgi:hypothetical protein